MRRASLSGACICSDLSVCDSVCVFFVYACVCVNKSMSSFCGVPNITRKKTAGKKRRATGAVSSKSALYVGNVVDVLL